MSDNLYVGRVMTLYTPNLFQNQDRAEWLALMRDYPFATLITPVEESPFVSHLPLLIHEASEGEIILTGDLIRSIVGFEVRVSRIEGKFKLSQNRTPEDRQGVVEGLGRRSDEMSRRVLELMKREVT